MIWSAGAEVAPYKWNRDIPGCELGLTLIELDLVDLKSLPLRSSNRLEVHVIRSERNRRYIKALRRIRGIDVGMDSLHVSVAPVFKNKLQVARIPPRRDRLPARRSLGEGRGNRHSLAVPLPIQFERACQFGLVAEGAQERLHHGQICNTRGHLAVVVIRAAADQVFL